MFSSESAPSYSTDSSQGPSTSSYSSNSYSSPNSYSSKKGFVISAGGSTFISDKPLTEKIRSFCETISQLSSEFNFVIVVGGGRTARNYIESAKALGANNFELDTMGIASTRLNALLFTSAFGKSSSKVVTDFYEAKKIIEEGKIPIFGGMSEGQTSDAVAALLAELLGYDFVNLSNVDGIYNVDPNQYPDAVLYREISFNDMNFLLREKLLVPGQHLFVDPQAASILSRSKVVSFFLNGDHLENFKNCLRGNEYKGTIVHDIADKIEQVSVGKKVIESGMDQVEVDEQPIEDEPIEPAPKRIPRKSFLDNEEEIDPKQIDFGR